MRSETLLSITPALREALLRNRFDTGTMLEALGPEVHAALGRSEPVPVRRATRELGDLGVLIRLFLLADDCPAGDVAAALTPLTIAQCVDAGLLEGENFDSENPLVRAAVDLRPIDVGDGDRWVISDLDGGIRPKKATADHVLGVGHASLSLLQATPTAKVGSVLDLGTGCGIQALHANTYADSVTATDINQRAVDLTAATMALNGLDVELLQGSWFEPVEGRTFDQVVANPPFVVGEARVHHTYRDSGLDLDGASELMISRSIDYLNPGGTAALLASWVHIEGQDWRSRIASWLPAHGVDAWVVQRDVADPALYVGTWLKDGGQDPRDPESASRANAWLDHLEEADVEGVGFGFVFLRRTDSPTDLMAEDLMHGFSDPLGAEALAYFDRLAWLREHDVLEERFVLDPDTALERVYLPGDEGWQQVVTRVHRGNGPHWQHEIDELGAALLAGLRADGLVVDELIELLAAANGEDPDQLREAVVTLLVSLVRHGLVLPVTN